MMTLEEAIKHCKDVALSCTNKECALEHFQLLKWLQEYSNMLEKQGESVEINPTEFDTRLQTLIGKFDSLPKEELVGSLSFWLNVVQNDGTYKAEEKQGEQNPIINAPSREVILAIWDLGNEWIELTKGSISTEYGTQLDYIQKHWQESEYYLRAKQSEQKPYGQREECLDCQFNYAGECKGTCAMKRIEQKPAEWSEERGSERKVYRLNNELSRNYDLPIF